MVPFFRTRCINIVNVRFSNFDDSSLHLKLIIVTENKTSSD